MPEDRVAAIFIRPRAGAPAAQALPGSDSCGVCGDAIQRAYFRVNGVRSCGNCADEAQRGQPQESDVAYLRGFLLGLGAAFVGMTLYAGFAILTNIQIGYMALAVGWLVGKAVVTGSHGIGGRRYQITALLLTYMAVSLAAVPIAIGMAAKYHHPIRAQEVESQAADDDEGSSAPADASNLIMTLVLAVGYGLASPVLGLRNPIGGIVGLIILCVGMRAAWRATRARDLTVEGPFKAVAFRV